MPAGSTLSLASDAAGVALGLGETISSAVNLRKDKKDLSKLRQPFSKIQDEYFQNRNIAESQAQSGLPSATKNYLSEEKRKGLSTGIAALLQSGAQPGDVAQLFDTFNSSVSADAAADAQARAKNIDYFINVNKDLAGQKTTQFVINELNPYKEKLAQLNEKTAIDKANIVGGLQTAIGSLSAAGTGLSNSDLLNGKNSSRTNSSIHDSLFSDTNGGLIAPHSTTSSLGLPHDDAAPSLDGLTPEQIDVLKSLLIKY